MSSCQSSAKLDVSQLPARFFDALDQRRYEDVGPLMAKEGVWRRQGEDVRGGDAVIAALHRRPADFHSAHIITNVYAVEENEGFAVTFHALGFAHRGEGPKPLPLGGAGQIGRYQARCVLEDGAWKIAHLSSDVLFRAEHL